MNGRTESGRTIGHGVILAYIAFAGAVSAFVILELLPPWHGITVMGLGLAFVFLNDTLIQRADMNDGTFALRLPESDDEADD